MFVRIPGDKQLKPNSKNIYRRPSRLTFWYSNTQSSNLMLSPEKSERGAVKRSAFSDKPIHLNTHLTQ